MSGPGTEIAAEPTFAFQLSTLMTASPNLHRRTLLGAGLAAAPLLTAGHANAASRSTAVPTLLAGKAAPVAVAAGDATLVPAAAFGITPSTDRDQTTALQAAIDQATAKGLGLSLPPGIYLFSGLQLRPGSRLIGAPGHTVLRYSGAGVGLIAAAAPGIRLEHLQIDGANLPLDRSRTQALIQISDCRGINLSGLHITSSAANGLHLLRCAGRIADCRIEGAADAGLWSLDADILDSGLIISGGAVTDCGDNGILVWRSQHGRDGTRISDVAIARIGNRSDGSGQYGNGINVFRGADVAVVNCRISDCGYSAIRGNASGNIQMLGNHVARAGEVALYAEFGFEGAMIANNIIDGAATGIAVANFREGGRLAVVQGNLVRNLVRREHEPVDKRGEGIVVEADAVVSSNVIEGAPTAGIAIGWGPHLRDVVATGNLIRASTIGIAVSGDTGAGKCLLANNMISGATGGAIRAMDHGKPVGTDLLSATAPKHIAMSGNVVA